MDSDVRQRSDETVHRRASQTRPRESEPAAGDRVNAAGIAPVAGLLDDVPPGVVRRAMTVGAAADPAESAADEAAASVVASLQQRPAGPISQHVHDDPLAGTAVPADVAATLASRRGGGQALPSSLRRSMGGAFGADFSGVRLHTDDTARALSDRLQAKAFTVGSDIYFRDGMPSATSADGQGLLAHELAHTLQPGAEVQRLTNPFRKKTDEEKAKEAEKKQLEAARKKQKDEDKRARKEFDARQKAEDKTARLNAKTANKNRAKKAGEIEQSYAGRDDAFVKKSQEHDALEREFAAFLDKEKAARKQVYDRTYGAMIAQGRAPDDAKSEAELASERAADLVWETAPPHIRAFRPLRFDEFDKALNEVQQARSEAMAQEHSDVSAKLSENEKTFGAPMTPEKAAKKVGEERAMDRRRDRIAGEKGTSVESLKQQDEADARKKFMEKRNELVEERGGSGGPGVGEGESQRLEKDTARKKQEEQYGGVDKDAKDAMSALGGIGTAGKYLGKGAKLGTKKFGTSGEAPTDISGLTSQSVTGLGQILSMVKGLISFCTQITEIKKGGTDPGAELAAAQTANGVLSSAASTTSTVLNAVKDGIEKFGGSAGALSNASAALPIVGLIGSIIEVIDATLTSLPITERLAAESVALDEAKVQNKGPLAAALARTNRRNGQLLEKAMFSVAKSSTMIGLHVAEVVSAGGFGIPLAAKLAVQITDYAHKAGHAVYDLVMEEKAANAKKAYHGAHEEGASRDLVKYDAGTAIDIIIVAAQKHKLPYARIILHSYGVTEPEVDSMRIHELREKMLDGLDETGDPQTFKEKVEGVKNKISSVFGDDKPGGGKKDDKTTWEKIKAAPAGLVDKLASIPDKIAKAKQSVKDKYTDARTLIDTKNSMGYKGNSSRGTGAVLQHMLRGEDNIEKSFAKVRHDLQAQGQTAGLPFSLAHGKERGEMAKAKQQSKSKDKPVFFDKALAARLAKASIPELYDIAKTIDPADEGNLQILQLEIDKRLAAAGASA